MASFQDHRTPEPFPPFPKNELEVFVFNGTAEAPKDEDDDEAVEEEEEEEEEEGVVSMLGWLEEVSWWEWGRSRDG
jgi:hypothetical protein